MKLYKGHRKRLMEKFFESPDSLALYETVELCLMFCIPRKDVKDMAKELSQRFGSFSKICDAHPRELEKIDGVGAQTVVFFKLIKKISSLFLKEEISQKTIFDNKVMLQDYCRIKIQNSLVEQMVVLFLNQKGELLEEEILFEGTKNFISAYPREIIKHALNINADFIVLAHNHPSGNCTPSQQDITTTEKIFEMCQILNIGLYDHFIVTSNQIYSMRNAGYIK